MKQKGFAPILLILGAFMLLAITGTGLYLSNKFIHAPSTKITDSKQVSDRTIDIPELSSPLSKTTDRAIDINIPSPTPPTPTPKNDKRTDNFVQIDNKYALPVSLNYQRLENWLDFSAQGFTISVPKAWNLSVVGTIDAINCSNISQASLIKHPASIIARNMYKGKTIQQSIDNQTKEMNDEYGLGHLRYQQDITINNLKGKSITYSTGDKNWSNTHNTPHVWQDIFLQKGDQIIWMWVYAEKEDYFKYYSDVQNIIASIR